MSSRRIFKVTQGSDVNKDFSHKDQNKDNDQHLGLKDMIRTVDSI